MSRFSPVLGARVSRREIALSPHVWFAVAASFAVFAVACGVVFVAVPPFGTPRMAVVGVALAAVAVVLARMAPPEPDSVATHVVIGLTYVGTAAAMLAFAPYGTAALAAAAFVGPLTAIWLEDRREIAAHFVAASVVLLLPSAFGLVDASTLIATCTLLPPTFVLGLATLNVLELLEQQSDRLENITLRDPLTGAGNRRMLDDRLAVELARSATHHRPVSVLALDLDGFKAINDTLGHTAGDHLLIEVARRLDRAVGERATVIRQGGDEFLILAPGLNEQAAATLGDTLQLALTGLIRTGVGQATYPVDAPDAATLLALADERLVASKAARRNARRAAIVPVGLDEHPPELLHNGSEGVEISRDALGSRPLLWRTTGAMFLFYAAAGAGVLALRPALVGPSFGPLLAFGTFVGLAIVCSRPPAITAWASRAVVALSYVIPALVIVACQPGGSVAIGSAIFIGPLIALRSSTRREAALHFAFALLLMGGVAMSGLVDTPSILALLVQIATMFVLLVCAVVVLEAGEAQARALVHLTAIDPLTGLSNRRHLASELSRLLSNAEGERTSFSVLALDLNGFKALNDVAGHAAGDALLVEVADRLRDVVGDGGLVARPGGDEFTLVLPYHDRRRAESVVQAIRASLGQLRWHDMQISTGVGAAAFPGDGRTAARLLEVADGRLLRDKYGDGPRRARA